MKQIDNYLLERIIGKGQFGSVFKGINKANGHDIAVKAVKRSLLKGKFTNLLDNEIKVLKTCDNVNIIKLYDLKKTSNNIYMILEYANEGDLQSYIKGRHLSEDEAADIFLQILNGFKTLVASKIMHRDFKLANILKHNGTIKIADFGFAKLMDWHSYASTMLGSPLNMAPEVLDGKEYNNKADIWSIGTVYYELLYGVPPYTGKNILDLTKNIKNSEELPLHPEICPISKLSEDLLRRMLVKDPKDRISFKELFEHPINTHYEDLMKRELELSLKGENVSLQLSRFYVKNNKVLTHVNEIAKREDINNFTTLMIKRTEQNEAEDDSKTKAALAKLEENKKEEDEKKQSGTKYVGVVIDRQRSRSDYANSLLEKNNTIIFNSKEEMEKMGQENQKNQENHKRTKSITAEENNRQKSINTEEGEEIEETIRELTIKTFKMNTQRILHERNKAVFLASVVDDVRAFSHEATKILRNEVPSEQKLQSPSSLLKQSADIAGFLLIKMVFLRITELHMALQRNENLFGLEEWSSFLQTNDFQDLKNHIKNEYELFFLYFQSVKSSLEFLLKQKELPLASAEFLFNMPIAKREAVDPLFQPCLLGYAQNVLRGLPQEKVSEKATWVHLAQIIDSLEVDKTFPFEQLSKKDASSHQFDFKVFYDSFRLKKISELVCIVHEKLQSISPIQKQKSGGNK